MSSCAAISVNADCRAIFSISLRMGIFRLTTLYTSRNESAVMVCESGGAQSVSDVNSLGCVKVVQKLLLGGITAILHESPLERQAQWIHVERIRRYDSVIFVEYVYREGYVRFTCGHRDGHTA